MSRRGRIYFETPEGEQHLLGEKMFNLKEDRGTIMEVLLDEFWEPRLNAASCRPVIDIDVENFSNPM